MTAGRCRRRRRAERTQGRQRSRIRSGHGTARSTPPQLGTSAQLRHGDPRRLSGAYAATAWCYRMSHLTGLGVEPVGQDVLRHVVATVCLAVAVLSQGAVLRSARYPAFAGAGAVAGRPGTHDGRGDHHRPQVLSLAEPRHGRGHRGAGHLASYPTWPACSPFWRRTASAPPGGAGTRLAAVAVVAALATRELVGGRRSPGGLVGLWPGLSRRCGAGSWARCAPCWSR